ncbi:hypothetical protein FEM48_Zijuj06G0101300 [Ziziphus jujuba var. spinosa]|uniref:Calmodulin-binding domain-containing protein n=1 Tax=Ziziphus jujuba var. spinosa TaxID=714518 RepID=A0A978V8N2_ZIZJJ|nr:hypothetical protein FEM48_Zijuj06G0101300 [Ziziphus jujuba var. spinosa]
MATKPKESSSVGKEKKVPLSSSTHTTPTRSGTKLSPNSSSTPKPSSSTSTEKPLPNYLKPTISSRHDEAFKPIKKHGSDHDPNHKATLNRRRSFDKPPSSSRVQSALVSPGPKERRTAGRSSSFSCKTTTSSKPISDNKPLRSPKPAKPQPTFAKTVKSTVPKKEASNASASNRIPKSPSDQTQTVVHNVEAKQEATTEFLVHEVAEVESEVKACPEEPKPEGNDQHSNAVDGEANSDENEDKKECEEAKAGITDVGLEETDNKSQEGSQVNDSTEFEGEDDQNKKSDEGNESHREEGSASEAKEDHVEEDKVNEAAVEETKVVEANKNEEKTVDNEKEEAACEGSNVDKDGKDVEEGKSEAEAEVTVKRQGGGGQGKKDNAPAYNDVIEETASKLLEKRKNKVKALVGAFETVIDYESK